MVLGHVYRKKKKKGKRISSTFFTQTKPYFLPPFLSLPAFALAVFAAGLAASFGLASGFFAMSVHL
jgi:hypothetical protein